ncbi:MAG: BACON domain-containing carbohydrate-binding protein [Rikenellaceae bacterium]
MKKIQTFLLLACAMVLAFGCEDPDPVATYTLEVNTTSLSFSTEGETKEIQVTSNADWSISVPADASWLSVSPTSGSTDKTVTVMASANDSDDIRSAVLTISASGVESISVNVAQAAPNAELPELTSTIEESYTIGAVESVFSFDIASNVIWSVSAYDADGADLDWLSIDKVAGEGNATITVTVDANTAPTSRQATLEVAGEGLEAIYAALTQESATSDPDDIIVFADSTFKARLFYAYAYHEPNTIDTNGDGEISYAEAAVVTYLNLENSYIKSAGELAYFTALQKLDFAYNNVAKLNIQYNTELTYLDYSNNAATSLDLTYNPKLTTLKCNNNSFTELDITPCPELQVIDCSYNSIAELAFPKTTTYLTVTGNRFSSLDISEYYAMGAIYCGEQTSTCKLTVNEIQAKDGTFFEAYNEGVTLVVKCGDFNFELADEATYESFIVSNDMNGYSGNYAIGIMRSYDLYFVDEKSPVGVAKNIHDLIKEKDMSFTTVDNKYIFNADLSGHATTNEWELSGSTAYLICAFPLDGNGDVDESKVPSILFDTTAVASYNDNFVVTIAQTASTSNSSTFTFTPSEVSSQYHPAHFATDNANYADKTDAEIISYLRYSAGSSNDWDNDYAYNKVGAGYGAKSKTYSGLTAGKEYAAVAYGLDPGTYVPYEDLYRLVYTTPQ